MMDSNIQTILQSHQLWLAGIDGGQPAYLRNLALTGTDFTGYSLEKADLRRSILTNCIMPTNCKNAIFIGVTGDNVSWSESDISNTRFDQANISGFNLIGATWNGNTISKVSSILITKGYWTFCTNAFTNIGCTQKTIADWQITCVTQESLADALPNIDAVASFVWWNENKQAILNWYLT